MRKTDISTLVDHTIQGHAPQFEQVDFLAIHPCHSMICIGQPNERNIFIRPVLFECCRRIGSDRQNHRTPLYKLLMIFTQARQLRAAIRSHESAQEGKYNCFLSAKIRKTNNIPVYICQFKFRGRFPRGDQFTHSNFHSNQLYLLKEARSETVASTAFAHCSCIEISAALSPSCGP